MSRKKSPTILGKSVNDLSDGFFESIGGKGLTYIADTNDHVLADEGECYKMINVITTTVIATLTPDASAPIAGTITGVSLPAGTWVYGKFSKIKLTSGSVIAYTGLI